MFGYEIDKQLASHLWKPPSALNLQHCALLFAAVAGYRIPSGILIVVIVPTSLITGSVHN